MTKQEFEDLLVKNLEDKLNQQGCAIKSTTIIKENGCMTNALVVSNDGEVMPMIQVDVLYQEYLNGSSIDSIVIKLIKEIDKGISQHVDLLVEKIRSFESIKNDIFASVINTECNKLWLLDKPHRDIMDLSIVYNVIYKQDEDRIMRAAITDDVFEEWGIEVDVIHNTAMQNINKKYPPVLTSIENKIKELLGFDDRLCKDMQIELPTGMIVVSNDIGMYGAIHMFNMEMLQKLSKSLKSKQLYIIPSSVHEIIVCSTDRMSLEYVDQMVREVNQTMNPKDVLSDHIYLYDSDTNKLI